MKLLRFLLATIIILGLSNQETFAFGKNKVVYKDFEWYYIQSKHFDVYFYGDGQDLAEFTAEVAESAYVQINRDWQYDIKDRIVFIVYNSHNDWQQTNVVISYLTEGIGGVTELFKNRIVVPFEGSYEQFRHVIHHELVHGVMNDMIYGGSVQSLIMGEVTQVPLWFSEGIAEFQSQGWNPRIDMIVRDAMLNNYMPNLNQLQYFLVYQGGASVFRYIATTYGRRKVGELLHKLRGKITFEKVLKSSIGVGSEEFTKRWHRYLRREYWPEVENRKEPVEIGRRLTDHSEVPNYLNVSPTISPSGDKIAFISDRRGYQNIYLMSSRDGEIIKTLVKGNRSESFEELHFLRPGMSFSPDSRELAFTAKSGPKDAIYRVNITSGDTKKYELDLDGAFTTSWSPDGEKIAFVGNDGPNSDIYVLNLRTDKLIQLTNDVFSDDEPSWSPDSRKIAFVSDRKDYLNRDSVPGDFRMSQFDFEKNDIYIVDVETKNVERITDTPWDENSPIFSPDGNTLAYLSTKNGISNLYFHEMDNGEDYPVTNIISGIFQINWDRHANKMVFSSFFNGGFDIYILNNPLGLTQVELTNTKFVEEMQGAELPVYARNWKPDKEGKKSYKIEKVEGKAPHDYSNYVFTRHRMKDKEEKEKKEVELSENSYQDDDGNYKVHKYKLKFSPDIVTGSAGYNTFFGFAGYTTFAFSDLLGDHKIFLNLNLVADLKNSDLSLLYLNLKNRLSFGIGGYHQAFFPRSAGFDLQRYRNYGINLLFSYPFSRFKRLELLIDWYNVRLENLTNNRPDILVSTILPTMSYVHDNVLWGSTGPVSGSRYALSFTASPKYNDDSRDFRTVNLDYRKYFMLNRDYQFAFRLASGASFGKDPQRFFLGGISNWINWKARGGLRDNNIEDIFFSRFVTPLRGAFYYEAEGSRYALSNMEFRFPLIQHLGLGFPPLHFFNVRGALFYDIGTAWDSPESGLGNPRWRATKIDENGNRVFDDIVSGYGVGARVFFLYFLMRIDLAWQFDLHKSSKPIWYISLGAEL